MDDERLRRCLETLNRGQPPANGADSMGDMPTERSDVGMSALRGGIPPLSCAPAAKAASPSRRRRAPSGTVPPIPGLVRRGEVVATSAGEHLRVRLPLDELWPSGSRMVAARQQHLQRLVDTDNQQTESPVAMHEEFAAFATALPDRVLLLDLETCGLAGAALFLVGLLRHVDGSPTVELLVARNYSEEEAVLKSLWQAMAAHEVLVTFNGKSFDWPMVVDRSTRYHLPVAWGPPDSTWARLSETRIRVSDFGELSRVERRGHLTHIDVLHHARRRWRGVLPDCRLQTLEELVCRRRREGDIPGAMIPAAYAEYVRTGFERDMDAILYHNAVDLVTLLDLALRLAA